MADSAVHDLVVDLAAALEEHLVRHTELLERVRAFRVELLGPDWDPARGGPYTPAPPVPLAAAPPLAPHHPTRLTPLAPAAPPAPTTPLAEPMSGGLPAATEGLLRALKRDYDYFAELDAKLAALEAELSAGDADGAGYGSEETGPAIWTR